MRKKSSFIISKIPMNGTSLHGERSISPFHYLSSYIVRKRVGIVSPPHTCFTPKERVMKVSKSLPKVHMKEKWLKRYQTVKKFVLSIFPLPRPYFPYLSIVWWLSVSSFIPPVGTREALLKVQLLKASSVSWKCSS